MHVKRCVFLFSLLLELLRLFEEYLDDQIFQFTERNQARAIEVMILPNLIEDEQSLLEFVHLALDHGFCLTVQDNGDEKVKHDDGEDHNEEREEDVGVGR